MKILACVLTLVAVLCGASAIAADDLASLAGKWSARRTNDQGQTFTQTVEITQSKFVFEIVGTDGQVAFHGAGEIKLDQLGALKVAKFFRIRAGQSANDLRDLEDEFNDPYVLDGDTWTIAQNFDKQRDNQKPVLTFYKRVAAASNGRTLVIDAIEMADVPQTATWFICFEAKTGGASQRYYRVDRGYDKKQVTIPVALEIPASAVGQTCKFTMKLDDVDEDACTDSVDNQSDGEFIVSERGSQNYKPEDGWRYTLRWHLK
ncbi:MAG TPA: hypothetical protein VHH73_10360 [Verrucomicrobiae bacterium]|nr:hypothetical protein [Verrucomicrobiae bacterium]